MKRFSTERNRKSTETHNIRLTFLDIAVHKYIAVFEKRVFKVRWIKPVSSARARKLYR